MQYLCICQQPDSTDLFKGHGPASPGDWLMNWVTVEEGGSPSGVESQRWWSKVRGHHERKKEFDVLGKKSEKQKWETSVFKRLNKIQLLLL